MHMGLEYYHVTTTSDLKDVHLALGVMQLQHHLCDTIDESKV